jgi:CRISPR-associated exonuclease Cas4
MNEAIAGMYEVIVPISALQHYSYCPRQCALIHVEQIFNENVYTLRGQIGHERADDARISIASAAGVRSERALPLWSDELGLSGRADVVEFYPDGHVIPVEYKHGPRRVSRHDELQLCAQALCLEEMLGVGIEAGVIYSLTSRRRRDVVFDSMLRTETRATIDGVRNLLSFDGPLPAAPADARCPKCSLVDACIPNALAGAITSLPRLAHELFTIAGEPESALEANV